MTNEEILDRPRSFTQHESISYQYSNRKDSAVIASIAQEYGDRLEKLDRGQRLNFLCHIVELLDMHRLENPGTAPEPLVDALDSLSNDTLLALIIATAQQFRADLNNA